MNWITLWRGLQVTGRSVLLKPNMMTGITEYIFDYQYVKTRLYMSYQHKFKVRSFGSNRFYQPLVENVHLKLRVLNISWTCCAVDLKHVGSFRGFGILSEHPDFNILTALRLKFFKFSPSKIACRYHLFYISRSPSAFTWLSSLQRRCYISFPDNPSVKASAHYMPLRPQAPKPSKKTWLFLDIARKRTLTDSRNGARD